MARIAADEAHGIEFSRDKRTLVKYNCVPETEYTIPGGVTAIGKVAFYGCRNLTSVTIPACVTAIGDRAFAGCPCEASVKKQFPKYR